MRERKTKSGRIRYISPHTVQRVRRSGNRRLIARLVMADEGGQVLPWVVVMMLTILGVAALVVDCGRAMVIQRELQASTDAAVLAAAQTISGTSTTYQTYATNYSSNSGGKNAYAGLTITGSTTTGLCLTTVSGWGVPCTLASGKVSIPNAVSLTQTTTVPTLFAGVLGKSTMNLSATSTAAKGRPTPYNVALIVDSTLSMNETDSNCGGVTQEQCALTGVQQLLTGLDTDYDHVALFTFPNVVVGSGSPAGVAITSTGAQQSYTCTTTVASSYQGVSYYNYDNFYTPVLYSTSGSGNDSYGNFSPRQQVHYQPPWSGIAWAMPYTFPPKPTDNSGYTIPSGNDAPTYEITPFVTDYNTTTNGKISMNTSSVLVQASGGKSNCGGIAPSSYDGDFGTYYAGAIYAAQAALLEEQQDHANSYNVMIILGDGNSTSPQTWGPEYSMPDSAAHAETTYSTLSSMTTSGYSYPASYLVATNSGTYPSWVGECGQAVDAAQYAATYSSGGTQNNTLVFTIAYGSPTTSDSSDCASDRSGGAHRNITPCQTLQQMATQKTGYSVSPYFYSDWAAQGGSQSSGCQANSDNSGTTAISDIYAAIVSKLNNARLIPNGTT